MPKALYFLLVCYCMGDPLLTTVTESLSKTQLAIETLDLHISQLGQRLKRIDLLQQQPGAQASFSLWQKLEAQKQPIQTMVATLQKRRNALASSKKLADHDKLEQFRAGNVAGAISKEESLTIAKLLDGDSAAVKELEAGLGLLPVTAIPQPKLKPVPLPKPEKAPKPEKPAQAPKAPKAPKEPKAPKPPKVPKVKPLPAAMVKPVPAELEVPEVVEEVVVAAPAPLLTNIFGDPMVSVFAEARNQLFGRNLAEASADFLEEWCRTRGRKDHWAAAYCRGTTQSAKAIYDAREESPSPTPSPSFSSSTSFSASLSPEDEELLSRLRRAKSLELTLSAKIDLDGPQSPLSRLTELLSELQKPLDLSGILSKLSSHPDFSIRRGSQIFVDSPEIAAILRPSPLQAPQAFARSLAEAAPGGLASLASHLETQVSQARQRALSTFWLGYFNAAVPLDFARNSHLAGALAGLGRDVADNYAAYQSRVEALLADLKRADFVEEAVKELHPIMEKFRDATEGANVTKLESAVQSALLDVLGEVPSQQKINKPAQRKVVPKFAQDLNNYF